MTEDKNRCVITGLGLVCAIGNSVEESWENCLKGKSGIKVTSTVDTERCYAKLAAEVECADLDSPENADRATKLCMKAVKEALSDAKFLPDEIQKEGSRVSVIIGSCVGGGASVEHYYRNGKPKEDILKMPIGPIANEVAAYTGARGIVTNIGNACAAGTISIAYAADLIRAGKADAVIAGGSDSFTSVPYAGFLSLHALSENGCSPFNHCDGITLGEGSGVLVVESYEHAKARGAKIYCEVLGSGVTSDAFHITAPRDDGEGQMNAIRRALKSSGASEGEIGYINGHGTGTAKNDMAEFLSVRTIFEGKNDSLSVSSTKAMVGHCLGAAGSIEAVFSIKALTQNKVPATIGYSEEDLRTLSERAGKIDFMPNNSKEKALQTVMSNSFAFGGNNASIIFSEKAGDVRAERDAGKIHITGLGIVSSCGNGIENYVKKFNDEIPPEGVSTQSKIEIPEFDELGLKMAFYRKLDKFSQIQAVSGMKALRDAGLEVNDGNAVDIGLIVGTADGPLSTICEFQQTIVERGNFYGSAFKFPHTVYNAAGGYLSICSGIKGYTATITNGAQAGLQSVAYAAEELRQKKSRIIMATGNDENSATMTELYEKLGMISEKHATPYSAIGGESKSCGFSLGDGSTSIILESEESAKARGAKSYAVLAGYGMAHKSVPLDTIEGSGDALIEAVERALQDSGISADEIDAIVGFGNGCRSTDSLEIESYKKIFGERLSAIPLYSVKDTTGEGRAASAALSCAHAALLLSQKYELRGKAYFCDGGTVSKKAAEAKDLRNVLVTSYGFGGSYTAVIVQKA